MSHYYKKLGLVTLGTVAALFTLAGCEVQTPKTKLDVITYYTPTQVEERFSVERVQVVRDTIAYGSERGIYILTDKKTGAQYIGLSGVGITELGSHDGGNNNQVGDER